MTSDEERRRQRLARLVAALNAEEVAMLAALQPATDEPAELEELDDTDT